MSRGSVPGLGSQRVQGVPGAGFGRLGAKPELAGALRVIVQQVLQDGHPDLLQPGALGDLLGAVAVGDVKLVQLAAVARPNLGSPNIEPQVLQRPDLSHSTALTFPSAVFDCSLSCPNCSNPMTKNIWGVGVGDHKLATLNSTFAWDLGLGSRQSGLSPLRPVVLTRYS